VIKMKKQLLLIIGLVLFAFGCSSEDIPQAHKGRMFAKTGLAALYTGEVGFVGPMLEPGTHYTGMYNELKMVQCEQLTKKEEMTSLTKDGVQFKIDVYVRYSINCDDEKAVFHILSKMAPQSWPNEENHPEWKHIIFGAQLYDGIVRPAIGATTRKSVSPYIANEINSKREEIFAHIQESFLKEVNEQKPKLVTILEVNLSNLDFPEELDKANVARAEQAVLKDKAIAERERVEAEIETTNMRKALAQSEANNEATRIDALGSAYRRNPEYVQLESVRVAAEKGNLIVAQPGTGLIIQRK
jgi:regulator of protease activity HflC (stomatin/prohibitin superfamily)